MPQFVRTLLITLVFVGCVPEIAQAGMPSVTLTDVARMRVQTISFFLVGLLGSAALVQLLWNYLRRDFTRLPCLNYGRALAVVVLWGLLFVVVLTMISGARELMTPGAWEKQGLTYKLADTQPSGRQMYGPADVIGEKQREKMERLKDALWTYAKWHDGRFPENDSVKEIPTEVWQAFDSPPTRYRYVGGQTVDRGGTLLAYEPDIHGDRRLVLLANGTIREMSLEEILKALPPEKAK
jgi:hypothetical protein